MSEVLADLLEERVTSNEIINWIIGSGIASYSCSKETFLSHFLSWLHSHATHAAPTEQVSNSNNKYRYTPNRKRSDKRKSGQFSPANASHKGSRTPKSGTKTLLTPFKDSLSSLSDYPPLSSSTPVEDAVSRVAKEDQVLLVKRRVDFSQSFSAATKSVQNLPGPSSPPPLRRVVLSPASCKLQMSEWTKHAKETSPFNEVSHSLATSFNRLSNTQFENRGHNLDFQRNVTPTKPLKSPSESFTEAPDSGSVTKPSKLDSVTTGCLGDDQSVQSRDSVAQSVKSRDSVAQSDAILNQSRKQTSMNQLGSYSEQKPSVQKSGNTSSRKKKTKRVPLMTISNPAQPNWADKSDLINGKSSPTEKLDVKSLDSRFGDRFGNSGNQIVSESFGFGEGSSDQQNSFKDVFSNHSSVASGFERRQNGFSSELSPANVQPSPANVQRLTPKKTVQLDEVNSLIAQTSDLSLHTKSLVNDSINQDYSVPRTNCSANDSPSSAPTKRVLLGPIKSDNITQTRTSGFPSNPTITETNSNSASPVKRAMLSPAMTDCKLATGPAQTPSNFSQSHVQLPSNLSQSAANGTKFSEDVPESKKFSEEVPESKKRERRLVYTIAEIYTVVLNEVYMSNLASELQLLLSLIKSPSVQPISVISHNRMYFISTVLKGLDIWIRHLSPSLVLEIEKHVDISVSRVNPSPPLFASDISIASVPFQIDEDTRPQFPNDRVFHVFKRIRDSFYCLLRDWEGGHVSSHSWNTEQVLGERMKSLLNQKLQLAIFTHFSKLFISLLLKRYKADLCEQKASSTDKLKKLQTRLSESGQVGSKICGPATFPKSQDFFKTFIVVSQNYSLNKHLTDHLIGKITFLNKQTKSWFADSIDLDQSDLQEDFNWNMLSLQLLAKFLGLVWYMPYYTTQRIPPTVLKTLRESRTEPFPLDLESHLLYSISDGTLTLSIPWICDVLVMMDCVCVTLKKSKAFLAIVNNLYNQLSYLPIRTENKVMLLFKLGRVMELLLVPPGLYTTDHTHSLSYEPSLDALPMLNSSLLYACCPWVSVLQHVILKQPLSESTAVPSTPTKISPITTDNKIQLQLRENFFHYQPHTVRRVCEFVCERVHSNALTQTQSSLSPTIGTELGPAIKTWIDSQDVRELLDNSLNSRLQFYLSTLVCKFCEDNKEKANEQFSEFCQKGCEHHMKELLPVNTEACVVTIATCLTVDKARAKCAIWWNTMAMGFVEREVQHITDVYTKHVLSEVENLDDQQEELRTHLENISDIMLCTRSEVRSTCPEVSMKCGRLLELVKNTVINKENTALFQSIADAAVKLLISYISKHELYLRSHGSESSETDHARSSEIHQHNLNHVSDLEASFSRLDPVYELLLTLRDKKGIEIPLTQLAATSSSCIFCDDSSKDDSTNIPRARFIETGMKLLYIGVLTPPRLEHWLLWFFETVRKENVERVVKLSRDIMDDYGKIKGSILGNRLKCVPGVAHFVKQYIVSDFEILRSKLNGL